jgi:predicted dehydrogenase
LKPIGRRSFVGAALSGLSVGSAALSKLANGQSPNNKVILALIGAGGRGSQLATNFARVENIEFKYICDVNEQRGESLFADLEKQYGRRPKRIVDMREVFDDHEVNAVVIATPEHWHALATIWACQAGKDVYVEKPVSLYLWESRKMVEAAAKYDRVVQCGTQNRSAPYARSARDYATSGKLGRIEHVKVYNLLPDDGAWAPQPDSTTPPGVDWDRFLGPAREVPFNAGRLRGWANFWDYGGGALSGDAIHQLDLARIVLGDPKSPRAVYCKGGRFAHDDGREIPDVQAITFDFGDFVMTCESGTFTPYMKKFPNDVRYGSTWPFWPQSSTRIEIYGTKQMMYLGQHGAGWQVLEGDGKIVAQDKGYFPDKWHQPNFIDCVRSRKRPNGDIEQGHLSTTLVHMGNIAYRAGNMWLNFDRDAETFAEADANKYLKPTYRKGYQIPDKV